MGKRARAAPPKGVPRSSFYTLFSTYSHRFEKLLRELLYCNACCSQSIQITPYFRPQITHQRGAQNSDFIHSSFDVIFQTLKQSIYCNASDTCICFWQRSEITLYTRSQIARLLYYGITKRFETART